MEAVTRPSDIDAPARLAGSGSPLLRAILVLGLVVGALLLGTGLPRIADVRVSGSQPVLAPAHAALICSGLVRSTDCAVVATDAQADDCLGDPASLDPVSRLMPRLSSAGFVPRRLAVVPAWGSNPPHRPPRHA